MVNVKSIRLISFLALLGTGVVSLAMTPSYSQEPIDQPKLLFLLPIGLSIIGILFANFASFVKSAYKPLLIITALFLTQMTFVLATSPEPFGQQFFGTSGRNTGFLCYLALACFLIGASIISKPTNISNFVWLLLGLGLVSVLYDLLQTFNHDPIKWNNQYNSILGFLGNPDFEASFVGMASVAAFSITLRSGLPLARRFLATGFILISTYTILRSHAQQGLLVFLAGSALVFLLFMRSIKILNKKYLILIYSALVLFMTALIALGAFKVGPLAKIVYKDSVTRRGFYWHAAWQMLNHHPINGVGLDSYGDWYFQYRSKAAVLFDATKQSNAAHNVFLDMGANGGWPLFLIHISIFILAGISALRFLKREREFNWAFSAIFGAWIAYVAQAFISINQIGLAVWGWVLSGLLIGLEFNTRERKVENVTKRSGHDSNKGRRAHVTNKNKTENALGAVAGIILGFMLMFPYFKADADYRKAVIQRNAFTIINATNQSPRDESRSLQTVQLLMTAKLTDQSLAILHSIVKENPRNYNAWGLLAQIEKPNSPGALLAQKMIREQNPQQLIK